ncbi:MAG: hypothetical protein V9G24_11620 [Rhodoblastus sp.]
MSSRISVRDSAAMLDATEGPELVSPYHAPPHARAYADEVRPRARPPAHRLHRPRAVRRRRSTRK